MRHEPLRIDAVASKAATEVVVHPAARHRIERHLDDARDVVVWRGELAAEQKVEVHRARELRGPAESTPRRVEGVRQNASRVVQDVCPDEVRCGADECGAPDGLHQGGDVVVDVRTLVDPRIGDGIHQLNEGRPREVRAAVERFAARGEEHRHRPAAATRHRLHRIHVDRIDVGAFLAVDLHVDEERVHDRCGLDVLEALVGHHVTPVACRVTDGEQDRDVATLRLCECVSAPREPVDGVVLVLPEIRRGLGPESIGHDDVSSWSRRRT